MISRNSIAGAFPLVRLAEVVEFLDSKRRPVTESERCAGPYPYFGANGKQGTIDGYLFDEPLVLLAEDGGHFAEPDRGIAYRISGKTWVNNHAHVLRPRPQVDLAFLCRVLENYDVTPFVTGTTRGKLTKAGASEIVIPLPPLAEQRRIAEVLDRAEKLRAKRREAIPQLLELAKAAFFELFGHPQSNTKVFPRKPLAELCKRVTVGYVGPMAQEYVGSGVPLLRSLNVRRGRIDLADLKFVSPGFHSKLRKSAIYPGDVVTVRTGQPGTTAVVPEVLREANCADLIVMTCGPYLDARYLSEALNLWLGDADSIQGQVGAIQVHFNIGRAKELKLPVPPLALQQEFSRLVAAVERLEIVHRTSLAELDALFTSLQHRAFRGEL